MSNGSSLSLIRQNFSDEAESALNYQINFELYASYVYLSMANYFDRADVALKNIAKWMFKQSEEERHHACTLMEYQNTRGGRVIFSDIPKPEKNDWGSALDAFRCALAIERTNNENLLNLHRVAESKNDFQMTDFIEDKFLREQVESIEEIGGFITNLERVGTGMGEYVFDKEHFE
ncbi:unnamed protein product [Dracunculus medinensis]|uniref:Ferritin n=1 Tax=Dracunculus medinensis TaxID=318479 RepID=A0A0N4U915_DRAME|nr:unnamed protein product [Dracunculus medinensis]